MAKKPTAAKKPAAENAPAEVTAPAVEVAEAAQAEPAGEPAPSPSMPSAPTEATPDGAREPWPVRLEKMSRDEIQTLLQGNTLGERKRAEAKARLASL